MDINDVKKVFQTILDEEKKTNSKNVEIIKARFNQALLMLYENQNKNNNKDIFSF